MEEKDKWQVPGVFRQVVSMRGYTAKEHKLLEHRHGRPKKRLLEELSPKLFVNTS
ncbi:hypothetical protein [Endozoicomonas numazuensis]|uniref:hypothetical protein n=1 Tax=Endozoicomonas numazuensis TaxID=1137799 RepID=UPI000A94FE1A|nr:hypothetical protein [Endozoicomonas numazuensis]